jgi:hypothetical protein
MPFTIDENMLDFGFEGGAGAMEFLHEKGTPNWVVAILVVFLLLVLWVVSLTVGLKAGADALSAKLMGKEGMERNSIVHMANPGMVNANWGSGSNRLGGGSQSDSPYFGEQFTSQWKDGKIYSDEKGHPHFVAPGPDGKYQALNPEAPGYFPTQREFSEYSLSQQNQKARERLGMAYKVGEVSLLDCPQWMADKGFAQRGYDDAAWDFMKTEAESADEGAVKKEYFANQVTTGDLLSQKLAGF